MRPPNYSASSGKALRKDRDERYQRSEDLLLICGGGCKGRLHAFNREQSNRTLPRLILSRLLSAIAVEAS